MRHILVTIVAGLALAISGAGAAYATDPGTPAPDPGTDTTATNADTQSGDSETTQTNVGTQIATIVQSGSVVYICIITNSPGASCGDAIQVNQANIDQYMSQCNTTADGSCNIINVVGPSGSVSMASGKAGPSHVFLCYSDFQVNPGVWPSDMALSLLAEGYWEPAAVWGNTYKGTNIGDFHLVCNAAADMSETGDMLGGGGDINPVSEVGYAVGWYPIIAAG